MEEKDINLIVEKVGAEAKAKFDSLKEELAQGFLTDEQFKEGMTAFADEHDIKGLSEGIEKLGIEIKVMREAQKKNEKPLSFKEELKTGYEDVKKAFSEGKKTAILSLKSNVATTSIDGNTNGTYIPGFGQQAYRSMVFEQFFQRFTLGAGQKAVYYTDQETVTRNAANKNEAAAAPESALAWKQYSLEMGKILDTIPLTHEAMNDIEQLVAEVQMFLMTNVRLKIDSNMWNGNGTLPNWKGIETYATAFTQAMAADSKVADASIYDLIAAIDTKISNGKESKYQANVCFMNPVDIFKAKMKKDENNNYIIPPFVSKDGNQVGLVQIVPSAAVTADTLAMGDARYVRYYDVEGIDLEFGLDGTDFTEDLVTLKARKRGNLLVRNVDATAFYKVDSIKQRVTDLTA